MENYQECMVDRVREQTCVNSIQVRRSSESAMMVRWEYGQGRTRKDERIDNSFPVI